MVTDTKKETEKSGDSIWSLVNGLIMVAIGAYMWFRPEEALMASGLYLGVALMIVGAIYLKTYYLWSFGWHLALGLTDVLVGLIIATGLNVNYETFVAIIGLWALFTGIIQVSSASRLRNVSFRWSWVLAGGLLGIVFGFIIISYPFAAMMSLAATISLYLVLYGALQIVDYSFKEDIQI